MSRNHAIIIFFSALMGDLLVSYLFEYSVWLPYFSLAVLPALIMFASTRAALLALIVEALFLWVIANINIGIAIFSVGILALLIKDVVIHIFHTTTWQSTAASTGALLISLGLLGVLPQYLSNGTYLSTRLLIGSITTAVVSFGFSLIAKSRYA